MKDKIVLYHGSKDIIKTPVFGKGNIHNDYGLGFYCTEDIELAKEWAVSSTNDGYANKYELDTRDLNVLYLSKYNDVLYWITILIENREFMLKSDVSKRGRDYLIKHFHLDLSKYDVVVGYRADDSYFSFAKGFLDNTISIQRLSEALALGELGEQVVLISKKAFSKLSYLGYEEANKDIYYPKRATRNENARKEFLSNKRGKPVANPIYLIDIIRGDKND